MFKSSFPHLRMGYILVFCSNCGKELDLEDFFCSKCGVRTRKGIEAGISTRWKDLKGELSRVGEEMEKAFTIAGKEMEKAFRTARDKFKEVTSKEPIVCPNCGEESLTDAKFCHNCGKKL